MKKIKKIIAYALMILMIVSIIPNSINIAYAGTVTSTAPNTFKTLEEGANTKLNKDTNYHKFYKNFTFGTKGNMMVAGVASNSKVYYIIDNPFNSSDGISAGSIWPSQNETQMSPGDVKKAEMGTMFNFATNNLLGAVRKGQVKYTISTRLKAYKYDSDYARAVFATADSNGKNISKVTSDKYENTDEATRTHSGTVSKDAYVACFALYCERSGGTVGNKDLSINISKFDVELKDTTAPYLQKIEIDNPLYIRQDTNKAEPGVYITLSEEVTFDTTPTVTLTNADDGTTVTITLEKNGCSEVQSNGDVTYKFYINKNNSAVKGKNFNKIKVNSFSVTDTLGNKALITQSSSIDKRLDFKAPSISYLSNQAKFQVKDIYGLSKVTYTLVKDGITNKYNKYDIGDLRNQKIDDTIKEFTIDVTESIPDTGIYNVKLEAWDLDTNYMSNSQSLFLISPEKAIDLELQNTNNITFNNNSSYIGDVSSVKSNLTIKTSIPSKYLSQNGTKIYYKWSQNINDDLLNTNSFAGWEETSFKSNSNETNEINIPVVKVTENGNTYLKPAYDSGYLYMIPVIDDDATSNPAVRTGMRVTNPVVFPTAQLFNVTYDEVTDCGCDVTNPDSLDHYSSYGRHNKDIAFSVSDNSELDKITYKIKAKESNAVLASGTVQANSSVRYSIPLSKVYSTTGEYVLSTMLHSKNGTVSSIVDKIIRIENPIISRDNYIYNTAIDDSYIQFDLLYRTNSINKKISKVEIQFTDNNQLEFDENLGVDRPIYAVEKTVEELTLENMGDYNFVQTEYKTSGSNTIASFRASINNIAKNAGSFVAEQGEKRIHIRITTEDGTVIVNNNAYIIKKTNTPPDIQSSDVVTFKDKFVKTLEIDDIEVKDLLVGINSIKYAWISTEIEPVDWENAASVEFEPNQKEITVPIPTKEINNVNNLYETYYFSVQAENSGGIKRTKTYGPFYIVNSNIDEKRYQIGIKDDSQNKQLYVTVDDKLSDVNNIVKADKLELIWVNSSDETKTVSKTYKLDTNISTNLLKIPYIELQDLSSNSDTGTWVLKTVKVINDKPGIIGEYTSVTKTIDVESNITVNLVKKFIGFSTDTINVNNIDINNVKYKVQNNPVLLYNWSGISAPNDGKISIDNSGYNYSGNIYVFVQGGGIITRFRIDKEFNNSAIIDSSKVNVKLGMSDSIYNSDGKNNIIIISSNNGFDIDQVRNVEVYDNYSATTQTAISAKIHKVKDNTSDKLVVILDTPLVSIPTSGSAISVVLNGKGDKIDVVSQEFNGLAENSATLEFKLNDIDKQIGIISTNVSNAKLFSQDGIEFNIKSGSCNVYSNGTYMLVYMKDDNVYVKTLDVEGIELSKDIDVSYKSNDNDTVTATITLPYGAYIANDPYGVAKTDTTDFRKVTIEFDKNATYKFDVIFIDGSKTEDPVVVCVDSLQDNVVNLVPSLVTSGSAITGRIIYTYGDEDEAIPANKLINSSVKATISINDEERVINNNKSNSYVFDKNGTFYFVIDTQDGIKVVQAAVNSIDRECPLPIAVEKYVWSDKNQNDQYDEGEESATVLGPNALTKQNILVKIEFDTNRRSVRLDTTDSSGYIPVNDENGFAYEFIKAYEDNSIDVLTFRDSLGNVVSYQIDVNEIDRNPLITQLNYSTTNFTNKDVVVSMIASKAIDRFDYVLDAEGNKIVVDGKELTKEASPTYIFKQNGYKDFNYVERNYAEGEGIKGSILAGVTWIDKSIPTVKITYDESIVNTSVDLNLVVENEKASDIRVVNIVNNDVIVMHNDGNDAVATINVTENGLYQIAVTNKFGNTAYAMVAVSCIDKQAPVLTLNGRQLTVVKKGEIYNDLGATALDNVDGVLTEKIVVTDTVDTSKVGEYTLKYDVEDNAGNIAATITRTVKVVDIQGAVALVQGEDVTMIKLKNGTGNVNVPESSIVTVDIFGVEGKYTVKYVEGTDSKYTAGFFKYYGMYVGDAGVITMTKGKTYTIYVQDQERNTFIFTVNAQ